jgi:hypothetical protein
MENVTVDIYNGWEIQVKPEQHQCANYSFSVTSPQGKVQHVKHGGENATRALERAREFVDLELAFADGQ